MIFPSRKHSPASVVPIPRPPSLGQVSLAVRELAIRLVTAAPDESLAHPRLAQVGHLPRGVAARGTRCMSDGRQS
eukprot:3143003-Pyramimonas_sp.AAC.1